MCLQLFISLLASLKIPSSKLENKFPTLLTCIDFFFPSCVHLPVLPHQQGVRLSPLDWAQWYPRRVGGSRAQSSQPNCPILPSAWLRGGLQTVSFPYTVRVLGWGVGGEVGLGGEGGLPMGRLGIFSLFPAGDTHRGAPETTGLLQVQQRDPNRVCPKEWTWSAKGLPPRA